jgi:3-hydroxyacyl-CoA dehydrogenase / enoyl-CoA hydratase / 3-hydroxybutyryl-CoA epimerase
MEALRALEEGVIKSADDADLASVLGLGFPRGGVLQWVESQGLSYFVGRSRELARQHGARFEPSIWLTCIANNGGDLRTAPFKAEALRRESPLT